MGRWDDRPDDSSDDWRGWKGGKYDSRYSGNKRHNKNQTKSYVVIIFVGFVIIGGIYAYGTFNVTHENTDTSTQTTELSSETSKEDERKALKIEEAKQNYELRKIQEIEEAKQNLTESAKELVKTREWDREYRGLPPLTLDEIKQIQESELRKAEERKEKERINNELQDKMNKPPLSLDELKQFALDDINKYRTDKGLNSITLGSAKSPQLYAQELAKEGCIHHISVRGEGPMLRYKNNGDEMYLVSENISVTGIWFDGFLNNRPEDEILEHNKDMMFDDASSGWGHRDNILDPHHKSVSIGISYLNDKIFVMVQDFESVLSEGYEYDPSSFEVEPRDDMHCVSSPSG